MIQIGDNFNRANSANLGANWAIPPTGATAIQIVSNRAEHSAVGSADEGFELFNVVSLGSGQFAQIDLAVFSGAFEIRAGVNVRSSPTGAYRYRAQAFANRGDGVTSELSKNVAGVETSLATESATTWTTGDVLRIEVIGSNIRLLRNGSSLLTAIDSFVEGGGWAGVVMYVAAGGNLTDNQLDNWLAGDFTPLDDSQFPKMVISDAVAQGWLY